MDKFKITKLGLKGNVVLLILGVVFFSGVKKTKIVHSCWVSYPSTQLVTRGLLRYNLQGFGCGNFNYSGTAPADDNKIITKEEASAVFGIDTTAVYSSYCTAKSRKMAIAIRDLIPTL